jgi:hypothetical protein
MTRPHHRPSLHRVTLLLALLALMTAACSGNGASPAPSSPADAARIVLAQDARFTGIGPLDPDLIGQASWYEVAAGDDGWRVTVRIGWGDCEAGCISEHRWVYDVTTAGVASLASETGDPLPDATGIRGVVSAGPTCPVVTDPPQPDCEDRPVAGAELVIFDAANTEVARVQSAGDGTFSVELAPGAYRLVPQPVEGLMGTAAEMTVRVDAGAPPAEIVVSYDTGIR